MPKEKLPFKGDFNVHTVDATSIAFKIFGKAIVNTAVLGAFAAITHAISLASLKKAINEKFISTKAWSKCSASNVG